MENYSSDQAHKLARPSHTIDESRTETIVSIKMYFDLLCEMFHYMPPSGADYPEVS